MFDTGNNSRSKAGRLLRAAMPFTPPPPPIFTLWKALEARHDGAAILRLSPLFLLVVALMALAVFHAPGAQPAQAQTTTVWTATLTVQDIIGLFKGCQEDEANDCSAALTDDSFTYAGVSYQVIRVFVGNSDGELTISLDKVFMGNVRVLDDLTLNVGGQSFPLATAASEARFNEGDQAGWENSGLSWSVGDKVSLSLTAPPPTVKVCWDDDANGDFPESDCGPANRATYGYRILIGSAPDGDADSPAIYVKVRPTLQAGATVRVGTVTLDSDGNITGFVSGNSHSVTSGSQSGPIKLDDGKDYDGDGSISEEERKADRVNTLIGLQFDDSEGVQRQYILSVQRDVGGL